MTPPRRPDNPLQIVKIDTRPEESSTERDAIPAVFPGAVGVTRGDLFVAQDPAVVRVEAEEAKILWNHLRRFAIKPPTVEPTLRRLPTDVSLWLTPDIVETLSGIYDRHPELYSDSIKRQIDLLKNVFHKSGAVRKKYLELYPGVPGQLEPRFFLNNILDYLDRFLPTDSLDHGELQDIIDALRVPEDGYFVLKIDVRDKDKEVKAGLDTESKEFDVDGVTITDLKKADLELLKKTALTLYGVWTTTEGTSLNELEKQISTRRIENFIQRLNHILKSKGKIEVKRGFFSLALRILKVYRRFFKVNLSSTKPSKSEDQNNVNALISKLDGILKKTPEALPRVITGGPQIKITNAAIRIVESPLEASVVETTPLEPSPIVEIESPKEGVESLKDAVRSAIETYMREETPANFIEFYQALDMLSGGKAEQLLSDPKPSRLRVILGKGGMPYDINRANKVRADYKNQHQENMHHKSGRSGSRPRVKGKRNTKKVDPNE